LSLGSRHCVQQPFTFRRGTDRKTTCAASQITRKPLQVFKWPTLLLGKTKDCPIKQWYKDHFYAYDLKESADGRGGIAVSVPGGGGFDAEEYTAEELVGQILAHAKQLAEATAEEAVKEAVITVRPSSRAGALGIELYSTVINI